MSEPCTTEITSSQILELECSVWTDHLLHGGILSFLVDTKCNYKPARRVATKCWGAFNYAYRSSSCVSSANAALPLPGAMPELPPDPPDPSGNLKDVPKDLDCCKFCKGIRNQYKANKEEGKSYLSKHLISPDITVRN
jgi:hypothetical protein